MPMISAVDPASHVAETFPDGQSLYDAIKQKGFIAIRPDGTAFVTQEFEGGLILDGAPFNVYYKNAWYPEQKELLAPHWGNDVPRPPEALLALPVSTSPEALQAIEGYHQWKEQIPTIAGIPTAWLLIGGVAFLAWKFWK